MKKILLSFFTLILIFSYSFIVNASDKYDYVIPGGESIGLKIDIGVEVVGKYSVQTENGKINPWKNSKIEIGDHILEVDEKVVNDNLDLTNILKSITKDEINIKIRRDNITYTTSINVVTSNKKEKTIGLYVKDKMLGIGTLSFIYQDKFASLGHGIYENNQLIDLNNGAITWSTVAGIKKATNNRTGEKRASISSQNIGIIEAIKDTGVYGTFNSSIKKNRIAVSKVEEVFPGNAEIYTVINNNKVEIFDIDIVDTKSQTQIDTKGIKIKVTDSRLIEATGGIIQGMSGSPIIQNGKLVGVVSHVTLENPLYGYAMYAEWMLEEIMN